MRDDAVSRIGRQQQCVAVRRRVDDILGADNRAGTWLGDDHNRDIERLAHLRGNDTCQRICAATRRIGDDDFNGAVRIVAGSGGLTGGAKRQRKREGRGEQGAA